MNVQLVTENVRAAAEIFNENCEFQPYDVCDVSNPPPPSELCKYRFDLVCVFTTSFFRGIFQQMASKYYKNVCDCFPETKRTECKFQCALVPGEVCTSFYITCHTFRNLWGSVAEPCQSSSSVF